MDTQQLLMAGILLAVVFPPLVAIGIRAPWTCLASLWAMPIVKVWLLQYVSAARYLDPTAVAAIWIVCVMVATRFREGPVDRSFAWGLVLPHCALGLVMIVSLMWTTAPVYGLQKTLRYNLFSTVALVGPMFLLYRPIHARRMAQCIIVLGVVTALIILVSPSYQAHFAGARWKLRQTALGASPLNPAFVMAVASVIAVTGAGLARRVTVLRVVGLASCPVMMMAILRSGSRAMFLQAVLGVAIWLLVTGGRVRWIYRALFVLIVVQTPFWMALLERGAHTHRVTHALFSPVRTFLSSDRLPLWVFAAERSLEMPLVGHGVGSFAMDYAWRDRREFPHNLLLEALYEEGIIGLTALVVLLVAAFRAYRGTRARARLRKGSTPIQDMWFAVSVSAFVAILAHWDLADVRLLWTLFGTLAAVCVASPQGPQSTQPRDEGEPVGSEMLRATFFGS